MDSGALRHTRVGNRATPCETHGVMPAIFGHQGGWDEALMVLVPIALFVGLLSLANKRAKAIQAKRLAEHSSSEAIDPSTPGSDT